ncbi:MAG: histidine kinase dimerization/phospho-acceptor domain-containing protein, partial [Bacteroides sp.]
KGYLLTCEDITEKKAREQEIRNSYKKIQLAQKELSLALNVGKLISWNYQIEDGLFYKFNEQIEQIEKRSIRMILAVIHPDDRQRFLNLLDQLTHKQALTEDNILLRIVEGRDYRYYDFIYNAREDDKGNIAAIIFIQRDVTEDIQYQQNLISAKNKAEEADKLKSTFLANMSHEIRTPLNAIVGFAELLSETEEVDEKLEYKQLIETNSDVLLKLIGDILDLSKIEAGSIDIKRQPFDLSDLCEELYQSFKQRIKNPDVSLSLIN